MIKVLKPRYDLASRAHITDVLLPDMYMDLKARVKSELENASCVALTTDEWTSRATKSYNTMTATIINDNWKLREFVLCTKEMPESHTAVSLASDFKHQTDQWGLDLSRCVITADNAANIVSAIESCNVDCHVGCMTHVLNLSTQKGLKVAGMARLLGRIRSVVGFFHRSTIASNTLRKTLLQLELPVLKPIIDITTRWNSTFDMLDRYLQLRPAVCAAFGHKYLRNETQRYDYSAGCLQH